jgi:hypothetical protein
LWAKADRSGAHPPAQVSGSENNRTLIVQLVLQCQRILQQRELFLKKDLGGERKKTAKSKKKQQHQQIGRFYCGKKASDLWRNSALLLETF